jgi:hypothetical protein
VERFRSLVFSGIEKAIRNDPRAKSYEGALALHWPSYFATHQRRGTYKLSLSCSLFGETHHYSWKGKTWRDVFARATEDVTEWIAEIPEGKST